MLSGTIGTSGYNFKSPSSPVYSMYMVEPATKAINLCFFSHLIRSRLFHQNCAYDCGGIDMEE